MAVVSPGKPASLRAPSSHTRGRAESIYLGFAMAAGSASEWALSAAVVLLPRAAASWPSWGGVIGASLGLASFALGWLRDERLRRSLSMLRISVGLRALVRAEPLLQRRELLVTETCVAAGIGGALLAAWCVDARLLGVLVASGLVRHWLVRRHLRATEQLETRQRATAARRTQRLAALFAAGAGRSTLEQRLSELEEQLHRVEGDRLNWLRRALLVDWSLDMTSTITCLFAVLVCGANSAELRGGQSEMFSALLIAWQFSSVLSRFHATRGLRERVNSNLPIEDCN
jgi:uncharacterized membrane protein YfcA